MIRVFYCFFFAFDQEVSAGEEDEIMKRGTAQSSSRQICLKTLEVAKLQNPRRSKNLGCQVAKRTVGLETGTKVRKRKDPEKYGVYEAINCRCFVDGG